MMVQSMPVAAITARASAVDKNAVNAAATSALPLAVVTAAS
jgi:hypothetical protein